MRAATLPFHREDSALARFGYTASESAFVTLAALHGGYFLRRQAGQFFGGKDGGRVTQLVQKALALQHVHCSTWRQNVQLYHLLARPLYAALDEPDNRNRRRHAWSQVKNRVMRLDVALAHPSEQFLATERERLEYFHRRGISSELLPKTTCQSESGGASTSRFFTDKFPIFVRPAEQPGLPDRVTFTFVDEGLVGLSKFQSYLRSYAALFQTLDHFELIYVANSDTHFERARAAFERFLGAHGAVGTSSTSAQDDALLDYFRLRRRYEERAFGAFNRAELLRLRDARARFSSANYEALFTAWRTSGDAVSPSNRTVNGAVAEQIHGRFSTHHLRHDYSFFGGYGLR